MDISQRVSDAKAALVSGQDAILTQVMTDLANNVAQDQKASDGTLTQGDVDAAVAAAVGPLNDQIKQLQDKDAADLQSLSDAQAHVDDLQKQLDAMTAQDVADKALVGNLKGSIAAMRSSLDAIQAALDATTQPAPEPQPAPVPDQPVTP